MTVIVTNRDADGKRRRMQFKCEGKSMTEQSHAGSTNINKIIAKYRKSGFLKRPEGVPQFGDFANSVDYHEAHNKLLKAKEQFMTLPAELRARFNQDVGAVVDYIADPQNVVECVEMGLLEKSALPVVKDSDGVDIKPEPPSEGGGE